MNGEKTAALTFSGSVESVKRSPVIGNHASYSIDSTSCTYACEYTSSPSDRSESLRSCGGRFSPLAHKRNRKLRGPMVLSGAVCPRGLLGDHNPPSQINHS